RNLAVADQVEAGVADVHVIERVLDDGRRGAGGSHAPQFRMGKTVVPHLLVSRLQSFNQSLLLVVLRLPIAERILVVGALAAQVGLARYLNSGANLHPDTTSFAGMRRIG